MKKSSTIVTAMMLTLWQAEGFTFAGPSTWSQRNILSKVQQKQPSLTMLYSTKNRTDEGIDMDKAFFQENDQDLSDLENPDTIERMITEGMNVMEMFELAEKEAKKEFVMINANRTSIDKDPTLYQLNSEVRVWKNFRRAESMRNPTIPIDVVAERTWDTAEDIYTHARRLADEKRAITLSEEEEKSRKTVVILGSGWGAHALMKVADCRKLRIIVVSPTNHFVFTPMLASAGVGTVEFGSMTEAVRAANPLIDEYIEGKATKVDVNDKKVTIKLNPLLTTTTRDESSPEIELDYDHLVVSVGSRVSDMNVPGARQHSLRLKTTEDSRRLRTAVGEALEYASRPDVAARTEEAEAEKTRRVTFLVAGGGPTGVELAGELCDLFADVTRKHGSYPKLANNTRVILAHGGADLVPQFEEPLRKEALQSLRSKGVEVYLNTRVTQVTDKSATLSIKQFDEKTGEVLPDRKDVEVPIGLSLWCAGTAPAGFCQELLKELPEEARNPDGRIKVDRWMRPPMKDPSLLGSVLVLGDAAAQEMDEYTGALLPSTAQVAGQQGAFVARTLCRNYNLTTTPPRVIEGGEEANNVFYDPALTNWLRFRGLENSPPFTFLNLGLLAYLGGGEALSQVQVGDKRIVSKAGSIGFALWRSVYLVKQVATRNRILVTFDWIKSAIFGRDTTRF